MRVPGRLVWEAHQQVTPLVKPGVTTGQLNEVVDKLYSQYGAVPLFKGVPGATPFPAACCVSVNEEVVHGIPGDRVLREGDIVTVDTGCKLDGWCADAAVTHPVGRVRPDVQRLLEVTRGVLDLAIELMGLKNRWSEVAREMAKFVRDHGFTVVESFAGHGIGREMHDPPPVPNFDSPEFRRGGDFLLRPGLVLAVEPMVTMGTEQVQCRRDHWTQVTADGSYSAHFEHTVALTKAGPEVLTGDPSSSEPQNQELSATRGTLG